MRAPWALRPGRLRLLALAGVLSAAPDSRQALGPVASADRPLHVALAVDRTTVEPGAHVSATIIASNRADTTVSLRFFSGQRYEFLVLRGRRAIWQWSAGMGFTQALGEATIPPGGVLAYTERVPLPESPGRYRLVGMITAAPEPLRASVVVTVGR